MRKFMLFVILTLLISTLVMPVQAAPMQDLPPALPSSLYGYAPQPGTVAVFIGMRQVATTQTYLYQGHPVYSVDVPMDNIQANALASIRLNGRQVATVQLASGTNQHVDLKPPMFRWWR